MNTTSIESFVNGVRKISDIQDEFRLEYEDLLPFLGKTAKFLIPGMKCGIFVGKKRYKTFLNERSCSECGLHAEYFRIIKIRNGFNLTPCAVRNNQEVLFLIYHGRPKCFLCDTRIVKTIEHPIHEMKNIDLSFEEVYPLLGKKALLIVPGARNQICLAKKRFKLFHKQPFCLCCGLKGTFFRIQIQEDCINMDFCGIREGKSIALTVDHIIPTSRIEKKTDQSDNTDNLNNLQTLCRECNVLKDDKIISLDSLRLMRAKKNTLQSIG